MSNLVDSLRDNCCDCECRVPVEMAAANHILILQHQLTAMREAIRKEIDGYRQEGLFNADKMEALLKQGGEG